MQPPSSAQPGTPRRSHCPTQANREQALKDFHRRHALFKRDHDRASRGDPSAHGTSHADHLSHEARTSPDIHRFNRRAPQAPMQTPTRGRPTLEGPSSVDRARSPRLVHQKACAPSPIRKHASPSVAAETGALHRAHQAVTGVIPLVKDEAARFDKTMQDNSGLDLAKLTYQTGRITRADGPGVVREQGRQALAFISGMADIATRTGIPGRPAARTNLTPSRLVQHHTIEQRVMLALDHGIRALTSTPTMSPTSPERQALNGMVAGTFFVHLSQFYTRMPMLAGAVAAAAGKLVDPGTSTEEQLRADRLQLEGLNTEALQLLPGMKVKIDAMVGVVDAAAAFLTQAAGGRSVSRSERAMTQKACEGLARLQMALLDLQQSHAAEGSVFAQAHASFEAIQKACQAG